MLKINHLEKTFYQRTGELKVVDDLSIEVKKGEVFGFLGPNGAGKTTTVKIIAGLLFPDRGTITINSMPASSLAAKQVFGFMPEQPQFYRYLKAREVLELAGQLFQMEKEVLLQRGDSLLERVGLGQAKDRAVAGFSKGMNQRLAFAVALINDPQLLILDEPLDGLDPLGRLDFKKLILDLRREGRTVFFSSHILADVQELCDRVAIIDRGKVLTQGRPKDLVKGNQTLEEMFVDIVRRQPKYVSTN